jgi:hypothetical protein
MDILNRAYNPNFKTLDMDEMRLGLLPRAAPQMGPDNHQDISTVPETVSLEPFPGVTLPAQNANTDLMFIRSMFPYLPIMPFPHRNFRSAHRECCADNSRP